MNFTFNGVYKGKTHGNLIRHGKRYARLADRKYIKNKLYLYLTQCVNARLRI